MQFLQQAGVGRKADQEAETETETASNPTQRAIEEATMGVEADGGGRGCGCEDKSQWPK